MVSTTQLPDLASWLRKHKKTSGTFPNSNPPSALYRRCALSWKLGAALVGRILAELGLSVPRGRAFAPVGESDRGSGLRRAMPALPPLHCERPVRSTRPRSSWEHHFPAHRTARLDERSPCRWICVWCRVGARAGHARSGNMGGAHETIPRVLDFVGARIGRAVHSTSIPLRTILPFFLSKAKLLLPCPSFGRMPNHAAACSSVVSSR